MQRFGSASVRRRDAYRGLELAERLPPLTLFAKSPAQIHVGELPGLVPLGVLGLLEPGDGLVELVLLHQVDADVVIGVAELRIDLDGAVAFRRGLVEAPLKRV